tara:strand:+ start:742 stop:939 length:198 start_codon:yes stop_codon:yes gene_type:complete
MRQKLITLCPITWELALKKKNFSAWVRDQLRSERNATENKTRYCRYCGLHHPVETFYDHKCEGFA